MRLYHRNVLNCKQTFWPHIVKVITIAGLPCLVGISAQTQEHHFKSLEIRARQLTLITNELTTLWDIFLASGRPRPSLLN